MPDPIIQDKPAAEKRLLTFGEMRADKSDDGIPRFIGWVVEWETVSVIGGCFEEQFRKGAFTAHLKTNPDVRFMGNHEGFPMARTVNNTMKIFEDDRGLRIEAVGDPECTDTMSIWRKVKRGDVSEMSVYFIPRVTERHDGDAATGKLHRRVVVEAEILEASVVTFAAYPTTEIQARSESRADDSTSAPLNSPVVADLGNEARAASLRGSELVIAATNPTILIGEKK